jgi:hypothetical protein
LILAWERKYSGGLYVTLHWGGGSRRKFEISLDYIVRPYLNKTKQKNNKKEI